MYIILRELEGKTEILKDSNRNSNKTFHHYSEAEVFAKKLNTHTHSDKKWCVKEFSE
ncbi:hypothetical protein [Salinibacillus xinjiangensis]|uniref:Uncharacterized protein n=1 Tax=Salinibacillus xinjiangensis TaxID=1229268 RepID=A0A6G1X9F2_9BACI|nr:hypothetical protein [Salinibacillus xinjiangensis]MRG87604.1 hypothetical protein [Salinibacillus xinjiangensis]